MTVKRCPVGSRKNKKGDCISKSEIKKRCGKGTRKNKKGECVAKSSSNSKREKEEWNSEVEQEFQEILKELRTAKLKNHGPYGDIQLDCKSCLKKFTIKELEDEIASRKKDAQPINMLVPRKKNPNK